MPPRTLAGVGGSVALLVGVWLWWLALPPPTIELTVEPPALAGGVTLRGAFHVHTTRSDGAGTPHEVAEAARRAGLQFVVLTDHGDGTTAHPPESHAGVLLVTGVEISTDAGHYIALGMPRAPYPLGGDPEGVVADVRRLGGFGLVAHPTSPNPDLAWTEPSLQGIDGIEWLNADSAWRDEGLARLGLAATFYPFRPSETFGRFLDRPEAALGHWDDMSARRRVVGVAGSDAHARLIGYEAIFRSFSINLPEARPLSGDARQDANTVLDALRRGRVFTAIDTLAHPASVRFEATTVDGDRFQMGDHVPGGTAVEIAASSNAPDGASLVLLSDGVIVTDATGSDLRYQIPSALARSYRLEIRLPESPGSPPIPWIVTNPIYYGGYDDEQAPSSEAGSPIIVGRRRLLAGSEARGGEESLGPWRVEHDASSHSAVTRDEDSLSWSFRVGDAVEDHESAYAALVRGVPPDVVSDFDAITFVAQADRPARVSFQLRAGAVSGQPRWRTSFYVDDVERRVVVPFDRLRSVADAPRTIETSVDSLLLVSDLVNFGPGDEATLRISRPRLERWDDLGGGGAAP